MPAAVPRSPSLLRRTARRRVLISSLAFILGFSLVFIALGASATAIGHFVAARLSLLGRIAGAIIVLFGLHTMGVLRIEWLYQEKRVQTKATPTSFIGAMLVGIAFAFGWTPCIGPILAGILAIAATRSASAMASSCWRSTRSASPCRSSPPHSPSTASSRP